MRHSASVMPCSAAGGERTFIADTPRGGIDRPAGGRTRQPFGGLGRNHHETRKLYSRPPDIGRQHVAGMFAPCPRRLVMTGLVLTRRARIDDLPALQALQARALRAACCAPEVLGSLLGLLIAEQIAPVVAGA